jgi:ribonuclease R
MKNKKKNTRSSDPQLERESELYENPIPSRELILQVMEEHGVPVKKLDLIKILEIQDDEISFLKKEYEQWNDKDKS